KLETAKKLVPAPMVRRADQPTRYGAIYYGSTGLAMDEAVALLDEQGMQIDTLRVRGFPFADAVIDFIKEHGTVFVVEQNESAQLRMLLINEGEVDPKRLIRVLHYDGTPITARFIASAITKKLAGKELSPLRVQVAT
ncbi:MAG: 2-oxoacid:acceptor oxidoreductase subunit alpha, partial [Propionivibrio sp.]